MLAIHIPEFWSNDYQSLYLPDITNNDNLFRPGEWIHEAVTYDRQRIREYANGQLVNDWPATGAAIGQGLPMAVGAWPQNYGFNFQGMLDDLKIYSRALSDSEIQTVYNQGK